MAVSVDANTLRWVDRRTVGSRFSSTFSWQVCCGSLFWSTQLLQHGRWVVSRIYPNVTSNKAPRR